MPKSKGNGEGTIFKSSRTGLYVGQFVVNGKRETIYQKKHEKASDFKARFNKKITEINEGLYIRDSHETILSILKSHIEDKYNNNITSDRAYLRDKETIAQLIKNCPILVNKPIQKVRISDIKKEAPNLTVYAENSIVKMWRFINKAFKLAMSYRLINYNIMDNENITRPRSQKQTIPVEALTIEEQKRLIEVLNLSENLYNDALLIQLYTGMRIGEVLAISKKDIDLKNKEIAINKTITLDINRKYIVGKTTKTINGTRKIPITPLIDNIIIKLYNNTKEDLIFLKNNELITPLMIRCYLKRLNDKYAIAPKITTHMLRHSYATRCIEAGVSPKVLQKLLGHADIQTTLNTYTSVFENFTQNENEKYIKYLSQIL